MNSTIHALTAVPSYGVAGALGRIVAGAHWLKIAYAERRRAARERAEFAWLDERALRDLGMTRGEYLSYAAEARGLAPTTRLRISDDASRIPFG
jgi:uncharacterized protein YjiS (DUF1127 family)